MKPGQKLREDCLTLAFEGGGLRLGRARQCQQEQACDNQQQGRESGGG